MPHNGPPFTAAIHGCHSRPPSTRGRSGSGSTIFCIGEPSAEASEIWRDEIEAKYEVEVFKEAFATREADETLWYAEKQEQA